MKTRTRNHGPKAEREKGQTIALVAVAMFGLLAMAALAIDLTTLYVAHGEIQRAADAAALAGAKAFVDSGITTSPSNPTLQTLAQTMAADFATQVLHQNNVAGAPANFINGTPQINLNISVSGNTNVVGNPRITVTVQRTDLPVFFAKIFGNTAASVSATAIAEAFNPAYSQTNTGTTIPPAPKCVKPFLVPNNDPNQSSIPFVDKNTGAIFAAPQSFIGETITLTSDCGAGTCALSPALPKPIAGTYLPMHLSDTHHFCPNPGAQGCSPIGSGFQQSTQCCDGTTFNYQQCGVPGAIATWQIFNPGGAGNDAQEGLQCLIHTASTGPQSGNPEQDTLNAAMQIQPGTYDQGRYNISRESMISTSDSIITVPLFDVPAWPPANNRVTIVGFLQLFVNYVGPTPVGAPNPAPNGDMNATILNVIGCGIPPTSSTAVSGGGVSAIPVRLIHN